MKQTIHVLLIFASIITCSSARAQILYGLTIDNHMFSIADAGHPSSAINLAEVTGLAEGDQLLAIDMQPATGLLYGLAYNEQEDVAALYNIGIKGPGYIAVPVNTSIPLQLGSIRNPGFDFNPVSSSEIFITTTNGNVYIVDAASGNILFTGGSIFYAQSDINSGNTPMITGVVHTNSFRGADNTVQFGYDAGNNVLVQFDPNVNATIHTVGLSGLSPDKNTPVGMDSYFDSTSFSNIIFMTVKSPGGKAQSLVYLDPGTGLATHIGDMPRAVQVRDIAADVSIPVPATVQGQLITGLTRNRRNLVFFDSQNPSVIRNVVEITGLSRGQQIIAIDYRPFDLELYGLGYDNNNMQYQLYRIDVVTGEATPVNLTPETLDLGLGQNMQASFDFNPFSDRLHVIGANGISYHLSPSTGLVLKTDDRFSYSPTDMNYGTTIHIGTIAYTNSYFNTDASQQMGIDLANRSFISFTGNDHSTLTTTATLVNILDTGLHTNAYFDIYYADAKQYNVGYLATNINSYNQSYLYSLDPYTGYTAFLGVIGKAIPLADIAVQLTYNGTTVVNNGDIPLSTEGVYLYPNPANNEASVLLPAIARRRVSVTILDFNGNILLSRVYKPGGNQVNLDLTNIPSGMYSLRVQEQGFPPEAIKLIKR